VNAIQRIEDFAARVASYSKLEILIELAIIWAIVYLIVRFVSGTRAAGVLKGIVVAFLLLTAPLVLRLFLGSDRLVRLGYLYERFLAIFALALVVIFQPELRRAALRVGEVSERIFRQTPGELAQVVDAIVAACAYLSRNRFGALLVIERGTSVDELVEKGTRIGATISTELLQTIFFPGTALHDLAVVVRGRTVRAAGVQLPLADPADMPSPVFGSRHRAAVGLTRECDALVVVVSEQTASVRVVEHGAMSQPLSNEELRAELLSRLRAPVPASTAPAVDGDVPGDEAEALDEGRR
jgi:diadenylate cyclase